MNLDHLRYFLDAAAAGSLTRAARTNFVTQPAISRAIGKLEEDLGVVLIVHGKNRFQLTEAGRAVVAHGVDLFARMTQLKEIAVSHATSLKGPLRFGCNQAIASRLVAPMLAKIAARHPDVEPLIELGNTDQVQHLLDRGEIDFGIVMNDGEVGTRYRVTPIFADTFVVARSPHCRSMEPATSLIVSRTKKGGISHRYLDGYKRAYGRAIRPKLVVASWQVVMDLAIAGFGCALVPSFLCHEELARKTLEIVVHDVKPLRYELGTIVGRGKALPKNADAILACFRELPAHPVRP
jgi:DNA-binding transcriptional LysR family regulator